MAVKELRFILFRKFSMHPDSDPKSAPIGVFDSGVGGLSVLRALTAEIPDEAYVYLGDQAHVPYGLRSLEEVRQLATSITHFFLSGEAFPPIKLMVVACNTASAAALKTLRQDFPNLPIVGMEPAVKPAAENTHSGVVGVLATPATFQGALYASVVERFAAGVTVLQDTCPSLVGHIEAGELESGAVQQILQRSLAPMLDQGIDTIVLGCTHYPFVLPLIQKIAGPGVRVIDPAPAVARQARRVLIASGMMRQKKSDPTARTEKTDRLYMTSGDPQVMAGLLPVLIGETAPVIPLTWHGNRLGLKYPPVELANPQG